jgi:benzylsuccinate CoA-transferase BbsF subunit
MTAQAFEGIKALGVTYAGTANLALRTLGMHGATVVRVESMSRPCNLRVAGPFKDGKPGINRSGYYAMCNNDRYSLALNLKHPRAGEVMKRLIQWADVFIENFTPGAMKRVGLDYDSVREIKPDIVMLSISQQGQTGPHRHIAGYGPLLQGLTGHDHLTGWPDRGPDLIGQSYPDFIAPAFGCLAVIAALDHKRRTGQGQYIDLSNYECSLHWLAPALMDYAANGRIRTRNGNRVEGAAPHGVYPCAGEDVWCAIAVETEAEWQNFRRALGDPPWASEDRFADLQGRKTNEDELDALVGAWTSKKSPDEVMTVLQRAGVSAGRVQNSQQLHQNPQLEHRGYFKTLDHPEMGPYAYTAPSYKLSETPARIRRPFPSLGEHTEFVCRELLGLSDEEFVDLLLGEVFE